MLEEALALWRGPALPEFTFDDFARNEIDRLEELRLSATENRITALLRLGRHGELAGQLESLVAQHPLRERLRGQWMLALYHSGRQADALQAYRDGRRLLAGELGLEPGPELQRIERAILAQDPELDVATSATRRVWPHMGDEPSPVQRGGLARRRAVLLGAVIVIVSSAALVLARESERVPASVAVVPPAVVAVDARTNRIVASIPAGSSPVTIASGEGAIWVGDARDGTVTKIDSRTRRVTRTIGIGAPAIDVATGLGNVWAATGSFGEIVRIDPRLGAVSRRFPLGDPADPAVPTVSAVAVGDGRLWAGAFSGLVRVDPDSGDILHRVDLGEAPAIQLAVGNGAVWASLKAQRAARVEAGSGRETTGFYAGTPLLPIALGPAAVWLAGSDLGGLWKIDLISGSQLLASRAGHGSSGVALGAGGVWVTSWKDHALYRIDPDTGDIVASVPIAGVPEDVVVRDGLVWVAVQALPAAS